ncbi:MAG: hypothetical protein JSR80_08030 [Verrucomicrobia bacterium]|nr:hypothetical protein [Verrucomicrobiota bacterium]
MIKQAILYLVLSMVTFCPLFSEGKITPSVSIRQDHFLDAPFAIHNLNSLELRVAAEHFDPSSALWLGGEIAGSSLIDQGKPWIFTGSRDANGTGLDVEVSCGQMFCLREGSTVRFIPSAGVSYHGFWLKDNGTARDVIGFNSNDNLASLFGGVEFRFMQASSTQLKAAVQLHGGTLDSGFSCHTPERAMHLRTRSSALGGVLKLEGSRRISECFNMTLSSYLRNYWVGKRSGTLRGQEGVKAFEGTWKGTAASEWLTWGVNAGCNFIF